MDNLKSIILGVFSSLIAAGIIALAKSMGRRLGAIVSVTITANLTLRMGVSRWLINRAVKWLPNPARTRLQEEWLAHLNELDPHAALEHAISCTFRIPSLIRALTNERRQIRTKPRNRIKSLTNFAGAVTTIILWVLNAPGVYFEGSLPPTIIHADQQSTYRRTVIASQPPVSPLSQVSARPTNIALNLNDGIYNPLATSTLNINGGVYNSLAPLTGSTLNINKGVYKTLASLTDSPININGGSYNPLASPSAALGLSDGAYKTLASLTDSPININGGSYNPLASPSAALGLSDGVYKTLVSLTDSPININGGSYNPLASPSAALNLNGGIHLLPLGGEIISK